jgi:hypothetical protein
MRCFARLAVVCVAAAWVAPGLAVAAQDKTVPETFLFELKYKKGDKVRYKVTSEATFTAALPALLPQPVQGAGEKTVIYLEEVKDVSADGIITLVAQYEKYISTLPQFWVQGGPGGEVSETGRALNFAKEELPRIEYAIDNHGKQIKPFQLPENMRQGLQLHIGSEANMSAMELSPGHPVSVGEEWEIKETQPEEGTKGVSYVVKLRLARFEDVAGERCAHIPVTCHVAAEITGDKADIGLAGAVEATVEGIVWVRLSDCRIVKAELSQDLKVDGKFTRPIATQQAGVFINAGDPIKVTASETAKLDMIRPEKKPAGKQE